MNIAASIMLNILLQVSIGDPNQFNGFLILGYFAMWLIGMIYIVSLATRQRNIEQDVELMQRLLQEDEEAAQ
ncbi:MAG: hypothetical protein ACE5E7_13335 [Anaerolineae bacterium]